MRMSGITMVATYSKSFNLFIPLAPRSNGVPMRQTANKILYIMYMSEIGTVKAVSILFIK